MPTIVRTTKALVYSHPVAFLVGLFLAVRLILFLVGVRFDTETLTTLWQIADVELLRHRLLTTLWYLHSQPPLFNLVVGLVLRLGDAAFAPVMGLIYAAVCLAGIVCFFLLADSVLGNCWVALALAGWFCISSDVILFTNKLYYDSLVPWLLCVGFWGINSGLSTNRYLRVTAGFAGLASVVLIRAQFHPVWYLVIAIVIVVMAVGRRLPVLASATVPGAAIGAVLVKNAVVFGFIGLSSWANISFAQMTVDHLPPAVRARLIEEGRISRFSAMDAYSHPPEYLALLPPMQPTGEPSLDALTKSTGGANMNHLVYVKVAPIRGRDALTALLAYPWSYFVVLETSVFHFHRPANEFKGLERNLAHIETWTRISNVVPGLQPVALFGSSLDASRPQDYLLQVSFGSALITLGFIGAGVLLMFRVVGLIRARAAPSAVIVTVMAVVLTGAFICVVSSALDVYENNRARYSIAPVLTLAAAWFVVEVVRWVRGRKVAADGASHPR